MTHPPPLYTLSVQPYPSSTAAARIPPCINTIPSQLWLCLAFVVGRPIGDGIARSFAWLLGSPSGSRIARASTCYPYYHTWKHILCSGEKVRPMMPQCPLMFLHGTAGVKKLMVSALTLRVSRVEAR